MVLFGVVLLGVVELLLVLFGVVLFVELFAGVPLLTGAGGILPLLLLVLLAASFFGGATGIVGSVGAGGAGWPLF